MKAKKIVALLLVLAMLATSVATATIVSAEETYVSINDVAYEVIGGTYTTAGVVTDANLANVKFEQGVSCAHNTLNGLNNPNNAFDYSEAYAALPTDAVANFYFDPYAPANTDVNATSTVKFEVPDNATELTGIIALCNKWSANGNRFNTNSSGNYYMDNGGNYLEIVAYSADGVQLGEYTTDPLCKGLKYADEVAFNEAFKNAADVYGSDEIAADLAITDANDGKAVLAREFAATIPEGAEYIEITANAGIRTYFDHMTLYNTQFTVVTENEPVEPPVEDDETEFVPYSELNVTHKTVFKETPDCNNANSDLFKNASAILGLETELTRDDANVFLTPQCYRAPYARGKESVTTDGNGTSGDNLADPLEYSYHVMEVDVPDNATSFTTTVAICDFRAVQVDTALKQVNTIWNDTFQYTVTALDADGNAIDGAAVATESFTVAKDANDPNHVKVLTLDVPEGAEKVEINIGAGNSSRWDHIALFNTGFEVVIPTVEFPVSMLDAGVTHVGSADTTINTAFCNRGYTLANATLATKGIDVTLGADNFDMLIEPKATDGSVYYHTMKVNIPRGATTFSTIIAMCDQSRDEGPSDRAEVYNDTLFYSLKAIDADGNQVGDIVNANGSEARFYANAANPANYAIVMEMDKIPEGAVQLEFYLEAGAVARWDHIEFFESMFTAEVEDDNEDDNNADEIAYWDTISMLDAGVTHSPAGYSNYSDTTFPTGNNHGGFTAANAALDNAGITDVEINADTFDMNFEPKGDKNDAGYVYHTMDIAIPAGATSFSTIIATCDTSAAKPGRTGDEGYRYTLTALDADGNVIGTPIYSKGSEAYFPTNPGTDEGKNNCGIKMAMDEIPEGAVTLQLNLEFGKNSNWDHVAFFDSKFEAPITYGMIDAAEATAADFIADVAAIADIAEDDVKDKAVALAQARLAYERMTSLAKAVDGVADAKADLDALTTTEFENQWKADAAAVTNYIPFEAEAAKIGTKTEIFYQESGFAAACDFDTGETAEFTVYAAEAGNYYLGVVYGYNDNQQRACDVIVNGDTYYASEIFAEAGELDVSEITNTVYFAVELKEGKNTVVITKAAVSPANMPDIDKILVENIDGSICNVDIAVNEGVVDGTTITWSGASIEKDDSLDLTYLNGTSTLLQRINNDISETVDYGIIYGVDEDAVAAATDTASTDAGKLIAKKVSFGVDNNGDINRTFGVKMTNVAEGTNPVVKFYVTYKDTAGTEHTVYSDVVGVAEAATPGADE